MISSELSDETVLHLRRKWEVSEKVLEPLEMSDTEILDWMGEWGCCLEFEKGTWGLSFGIDQLSTSDSVRDVVRRAATYWAERNQ